VPLRIKKKKKRPAWRNPREKFERGALKEGGKWGLNDKREEPTYGRCRRGAGYVRVGQGRGSEGPGERKDWHMLRQNSLREREPSGIHRGKNQ